MELWAWVLWFPITSDWPGFSGSLSRVNDGPGFSSSLSRINDGPGFSSSLSQVGMSSLVMKPLLTSED